MTLLELVTYAAIVWYISYAVTSTHGPWGIFDKLREFRGGFWHGRYLAEEYHQNRYVQTEITGLLDCIVCLSIWVALALCLITDHTLLEAFAVAGISLWIHGFTGWRINM